MRITKRIVAALLLSSIQFGCNSKPTEPGDQLPPLISWNTPRTDTVFVTDSVTIRFTAADDGGVVSNVKVYLDGVLAATLTTEPFVTTIDFSALGNNRAARIYATATDPSGKTGVTADTLQFLKALPPDTATWTQLTGFATSPMARYGHSMSLDAPGKRAIIFGGYNVLDVFSLLNDTWAFNFTDNTWDSLATTGSTPAIRRDHTANIADNLLVVVCGMGVNDTLLEDFAVMDLASLEWTDLFTGTRPLRSRGMASASIGGSIYLYGGSYDGGVGSPDSNSSAFWRFSPTDSTFSLPATSGLNPARRFRAAMAPDFERNRLFLYGGRSGQTSPELPSSTSNYRLDVATLAWASSAASGPPALESAVAIYDSLNNRILLWGGTDAAGTPMTTLWQFSLGGRFWTRVPTKGGPPAGRSDFGMVKDPDSSRIIMFGGFISGNGSAQTWELAW